MKRYGNLWTQVTSFENLLNATQQAQRGKRHRDNVLEFNFHLEDNLFALQSQLQNFSYCPGTYRTFEIFSPKPRIIAAAPYIDRVVHHALCNIIGPLFESSFIRDTYANRVGYGTHKALRRFIHFAHSHRYILQCDIQKYFPSIDHQVLKAKLRRKLKCHPTLWLIDTIIDNGIIALPPGQHSAGISTDPERSKGLPIGNLTSQFFANIYLSGFDHYVQQQLKAPAYLRYVDDFALFSNDQSLLQNQR
jgi:retron-type reverse transcriptase